MSYYIETGNHTVRPVQLGPQMAEGAAGIIHRVTSEPGLVAKVYKDPKTLPTYDKKVAAMLAAPPQLPPIPYNGKSCVQIAWPVGRLLDAKRRFVGFVMPEVDFAASTELENVLQKSARKRKNISSFYAFRVQLAINLAALIAELHALGHHMIDMKPINMRFYPGAWYIAIIDTDGFSINSAQSRFPSEQFSDEYIAPEAAKASPKHLGVEQDLFALAVIIFRLLNNGIHPFQGVDPPGSANPTTLQERIVAGLYPYAVTPSCATKPAPSSIHAYLENYTRALFDRAFQSKGPRPSAIEWRDHLKSLLTGKILQKCDKHPEEHGKFSKGCGFCEVEKVIGKAKSRGAASVKSVQIGPQALQHLNPPPHVPRGMAGPATPRPVIQSAPARTGPSPVNVALLIGVVLFVIWAAVRNWHPASEPQPNPSALEIPHQEVLSPNPGPKKRVPEGVANGMGPSFDCKGVTKWSDQQVCTDTTLAKQDLDLQHLYDGLLESASGTDQLALRKAQRRWGAARSKCESAALPSECLAGLYASRLEALRGGLQSALLFDDPEENGSVQPRPVPDRTPASRNSVNCILRNGQEVEMPLGDCRSQMGVVSDSN